MKRISLLLAIIMLLSGCSKPIANEPVESTSESTSGVKDEFVIIGKYVCKGHYFNGMEEEDIPNMNFYKDGTCRMFVCYFEGVSYVEGEYSVASGKVFVKLDFTDTIFEGSGTKYMDDTYVFSIDDDDHITIDRNVYAVQSKDSFVRISETPEETTEMNPYIVGKYVCSSDYYNDEYALNSATSIPYFRFYKGYECDLYVDHDDDSYFWVEHDAESKQIIRGMYKVTDDGKIKISLHFRPSMLGDNPLADKMDSEYTLTLVDEDHLVIDHGFFNVKDRDAFVREHDQ